MTKIILKSEDNLSEWLVLHYQRWVMWVFVFNTLSANILFIALSIVVLRLISNDNETKSQYVFLRKWCFYFRLSR